MRFTDYKNTKFFQKQKFFGLVQKLIVSLHRHFEDDSVLGIVYFYFIESQRVMRCLAGSVSLHCRYYRCNLVDIFIFGWRNSSRHFDWSDAEPASDETEKSQKNEILTKSNKTK